jgi:hypothetical protein
MIIVSLPIDIEMNPTKYIDIRRKEGRKKQE